MAPSHYLQLLNRHRYMFCREISDKKAVDRTLRKTPNEGGNIGRSPHCTIFEHVSVCYKAYHAWSRMDGYKFTIAGLCSKKFYLPEQRMKHGGKKFEVFPSAVCELRFGFFQLGQCLQLNKTSIFPGVKLISIQ